MLAATSAPSLAQEAQGGEAAASDAKAATSQSFADYSAMLAQHYPTLRALVVARGTASYSNIIGRTSMRKRYRLSIPSPRAYSPSSSASRSTGVTYAWIKSCRSFLQKQLTTTSIYVVPKRDLVAAVAAESIPGGSVSFANDVVVAAEDAVPRSEPCVAQLGPGGSD
jgi:hypothetical protein